MSVADKGCLIDVLADIRSRWDAFGDERQQKIYEAMRMCSECSSEVQNLTGLAEESRTTYQGHEDDSDVYGEDHPTRPTFSTYRGHEEVRCYVLSVAFDSVGHLADSQ